MLSAIALLIIIGSAGCQKGGCGRSSQGASALLERVEEFRLDNGMLWLLVPRGDAPVVTGVVQVRVGGIEEDPGKAGLAHMFEHMAFKGNREIGTTDPVGESAVLDNIRALDDRLASGQTAHDTVLAATLLAERDELRTAAQAFVVPNELWRLFHENGAAELNAFTTKDLTSYYARVPTESLPLWIYLASEMVGHPVMREFYAERDVVMEERRSSVDNNPRGQLYNALMATAFTQSPYRTTTIGTMEELQGLTMRDAERFHATYYRPDRMVGVIVGQFDRRATKKALTRFFGALPATPAPKTAVALETAQTAERRVHVPFDAGPRLMMGYHKPNLPDRDDYVFDAIQYVLCEGETGRLIKYLERDLQIARNVGCWSGAPGSRLANLFVVSAEPLGDAGFARVTTAVEHELSLLRTEPIREEELAKARTNLQADFLWGLNSNETLAQQLAYFQSVVNDWRYLVNHSEVMNTITVADVQRVAQARLQPQQRTIATLGRMP